MKHPGKLSGRIVLFFSPLLFWLGTSVPASAHGGEDLTDATALGAWNLTPGIVIMTILTLAVYLRGAMRRQLVTHPPSVWRHILFLAGVSLIFLALQSPIDPIAEHLFSVHQVQHLLIRMTGPMLLALASPESILIAGLPHGVRRHVLKPVLQNTALRRIFSAFYRPAPAFMLFVAALYVWQVPAIHNVAVLDPAIHYVMHVTMLLAGLLFWWMIFDRRDPPAAPDRRRRAYFLVLSIVSTILLGALTTLKETVLYTAYDIQGRLFGVTPMADEIIGGYTIWVPSSMMSIIAILIVLHEWSKQEERRFSRRHFWMSSNSAALEFPETAAELRIKVRAPNRATGLALAATSLSMFVIAFSTIVVISVLH